MLSPKDTIKQLDLRQDQLYKDAVTQIENELKIIGPPLELLIDGNLTKTQIDKLVKEAQSAGWIITAVKNAGATSWTVSLKDPEALANAKLRKT